MNSAKRVGAALLLGLATFVTVFVCLHEIDAERRPAGFWLANGIALVALLRTPRSRWPLLVLFASLGDLAAQLAYRPDELLFNLISCLSNVVQYGIVAFVLRARFGAYFDLLQARQVVWLCALSLPATALKLVVQLAGGMLAGHDAPLPGYSPAWFLSVMLGLFVLSLPLLALSSPQSDRQRFDALGLVLLASVAVLALIVYGPGSFDGLFLIMLPLMLLAWRYGLFGAGLGALINSVMGTGLAFFTDGITVRLLSSGYDAHGVGVYLALFFNAAILVSVAVAVARAQQRATDAALAAALASAERRAAQLAESEAAIRRNRETLRQSEKRFRTIFEHAPLGIALIDAESNCFLDVNRKFLAIMGWQREALLQRTWLDVSKPDMLAEELEKATPFLTGEAPDFQTEKSYLRADGSAVSVNLLVTRVTMPDSPRTRFLAMIEDTTERRALQQQLHVAQRLEAVGQLTGGIAHDFNNILTVIIGNSEALAEELAEPEQRELARLILDTAERAGELTRHLLAFARRQPLSPRAFDLNKLLKDTEPLIRRTLGANLRFTIARAPGLPLAYADRGQTEAAILNLCLNARDAMPGGGDLTISTAKAHLDDDFARRHPGTRAGAFVVLRVSDTGTGIPAAVLDRIFEPFFTTKAPGRGTGLGLSMVYGFTKQSQGYIDVETEEGKGTTFALYLPAGKPQPVHGEPEALAAAPGGNETILVAEDDDSVREIAATQLGSLGYEVVAARDAREALAILELRDEIALLLTDVMMPGGMNGGELAERARALRPGLRVLFSSGYASEILTGKGSPMDGATLLPKPYTRRQLAVKVREALDKPA